MKPVRILHLEDDPDYCDLVRSLLQSESVEAEVTTVCSQEAFEATLDPARFDLVLADYSLPGWNGLQALKQVRMRAPDLPFLLVSGTVGEHTAIESLKEGATDYVLKHWPERLVPAIRRAVEEASERHERKRAETELERRERYFRTLTENGLDVLITMDPAGKLLYASASVERVLGHEPRALVGRNAFELVHTEDLPMVQEKFRQGLGDPGMLVRMDLRVRRADGEWKYLEAMGQNRLEDPEIRGVVVTLRDVTARKTAEAKLLESEQQYRLIFDGNPHPMWVLDQASLTFLEVNDAAVQHFGYSREEFLRLSLDQLAVSDGGPLLMEYLHRLFPLQETSRKMGLVGVWKHRKKDGTIIDVEVKWSPIPFKGRTAYLTMASDITERARAQHRDAALSNLGHSLSTATSASEAAHIIRKVADDLLPWDAFTLDLYSDETDLVSSLLTIDTDRSGKRFEVSTTRAPAPPSESSRRVFERGAELILRKEPLAFPPDSIPIGDISRPSASLLLTPIRNRTKVIGLLSVQSYKLNAYDHRDLSTLQTLADHCGGALERIRAEQALHASEQRFRELFEGSPDAIFVEDFSSRVLDVNPAGCRLHGLPRERLIGMSVAELVPPEKSEVALTAFQDLVSGKLEQIEGFSWTAAGVAVPVEVRANRIEYGGSPAVLLHVRDITERKRAEAALRSSEMLFHSVWENSVDGMRLTDQDGYIIAVNEAYCALVGMRRGQIEGKPLTVIYGDSHEPTHLLEVYREGFAKRVIHNRVECKLRLHDGAEVILEETSSFIEVREKPPLQLSLFRDVGARKRLEEQLRHAQKMEGIGQLAGGVAHDFNNILTVIHGHASLLLAAGGLGPSAAKSAHQISQAAERAAGLTRQLLTFSRRQMMQLRLLDLNEVVGNLTNMLGRILGEDIALQLKYCPQPAFVMADGGMLEQVLMNLAVNSRDAMPKGGVLTIRVSISDFTADRVAEDSEAKPGRYVSLTVADTGCGIAPENLRRIFEPFFTTKEVGKGTGLGLATVYGIVKQHQGWIEVESALGKGTTFHVQLPASAGVIAKQEAPALEGGIRGGSEAILVVEDEPPVRELVCHVLERHGYRIFQAQSGVEALGVWQHNSEHIDLLLTDLVMPDRMNGRELAQKLWEEKPELKVVFTSGYSADVVGRDFVLRPGVNYLQKPYHPSKLALTVRSCLDGSKEA